MTIEQRPELSRLIDPDRIALRQSCWRRIKLLFPFWFFIFACFVELMLLAAWLAGNPLLAGLAMAFGLSVAPFLLLLGLLQGFIFFNRPTKQVFQIEDDKIILGTFKNAPVVAWSEVLKFQFEPIVTAQGMTNLIVSRPKLWKGRKRVERRAIVVENPVQTRELLAYLQNRKSEAPFRYEIAVLDQPSPLFEVRPHAIAAMTLMLGGSLIFMQGVGSLQVILPHTHDTSGGNSRFSPENAAKVHDFLARHFSSYAELHRFLLLAGLTLVIVGFAMMKLGKHLLKNNSPDLQPPPY